jgi:hypothetical protein
MNASGLQVGVEFILYTLPEVGPGQSVYWQKIFQDSPDPTFVLLAFIWHAMYAWDEALEDLYAHICHLVSVFCIVFVNDWKT